MYIVAGNLKSRKIQTLKSARAVEARIRKVLYNVFREHIQGGSVLDLFAGSGALGIEALSWGAEEAVFVDIKRSCVNIVRKNLSSLGLLGFSKIYLKDSLFACQIFHQKQKKFDLIFLDPPYHKGLLTKSLKTIGAYDIVEPSGFIVILGFRKESVEDGGFFCHFERFYGDRSVRLYTPLRK
ncbi:MAG: 16S rRNA (guanine(966)-N(2))-methyltransferase RsmD [Candidatus Omnitrophica bacterium]|nr:16S rRNA (guanine(966)-N(2))-methyltransferase RsmD [Candidatus Omnitrophota bacterium]